MRHPFLHWLLRLPRHTAFLALTGGAILLALPVVAMLGGQAWVRILDLAILYVFLALGLNIVVGFAGLLDLGYIAFYAVGAYTWALLASPHFGLHLPFWVILPIGALLACLFGVLLGAPTLRLRGDYLAIVTLGFGEIIRIFLNNLNAPVNITNGPQGITLIDPVAFGAFKLSSRTELFGYTLVGPQKYYYLLLALCVLVVLINYRLQHSRIGRAWQAIREDEVAAKAVGINTRNMKLLAFSLGATFGGVAGGLFAAFQGFVSPESFSLMESIAVLTMIVFGGMGNLAGVIVGALALTALPEVLRHVAVPLQQAVFGQVLLDPEVLRMLLLSLAMIFMMLLRPAGLIPAYSRYSRPELVVGKEAGR